jgi:hypothetical protein
MLLYLWDDSYCINILFVSFLIVKQVKNTFCKVNKTTLYQQLYFDFFADNLNFYNNSARKSKNTSLNHNFKMEKQSDYS